MVRVGGGWDTLQHYLDKHDPCRCQKGKCKLDASIIYHCSVLPSIYRLQGNEVGNLIKGKYLNCFLPVVISCAIIKLT